MEGGVDGDAGAGGGGVSTEGGGEQLKSMVNHSLGGRAHPALKVRDNKISIRGTTICFIFTLFIVKL